MTDSLIPLTGSFPLQAESRRLVGTTSSDSDSSSNAQWGTVKILCVGRAFRRRRAHQPQMAMICSGSMSFSVKAFQAKFIQG